jgi:NADH-ubiquinone oxidoreductase chain 5
MLPLFGFLSGSIFGRFLSTIGTRFLTCFLVSISCFLSFYNLFFMLKTGNSYICKLFPWIISDNIDITWAFCIDGISSIMLCVVTFISSLVHLYSTEYMSEDPHQIRFMSYLSLFTFFMLILITANNFVQMFIGWEGVGVSSYLLINFWFTRIQANKSAIKAMLANRVGDFFLLLALFAISFGFNTFDYELVFSNVPFLLNTSIIIGNFSVLLINFICFCLIFGAMGKSAQLGLHTWLPDAMEGPTPVSALIHAATMVTAGVFLIARCSYLFEFSPISLNFMATIGICTAFFAATTGLVQNDMKKVIAYSTCSQLGYMVCACGLSSYDVGLFHLSNHAFFKALLFLGAGSVIHALQDEQDMRKMGGLKKILPFSYAITLIGSLALVGFPFLAGFYSKDVILELSMSKYTFIGNFSWVLGCLAAFCTAFYSTRLFFLVFLANPNGNKNVILNAHEGSWKLTLPLFLLAIFSIFVGYTTKDFFIGIGNDFWNSAIFIHFFNYHLTEVEFLNINYKQVPLIVTLLGILSAFSILFLYSSEYLNIKKTKSFKYFYIFFNKKWFIDKIYNSTINQTILNLSLNFFYKQMDRGLLEKIGPLGVTTSFKKLANNLKNTQTGLLINYLHYFCLAIFLSIIFLTNIIYYIY